jgi:hypothetical protein
MDVPVVVFDSWLGPLHYTLGDLIWEYTQANISQPSWTTKLPGFVDLELVHSVAGFLGVYGNLATCTFPHGVALGTVRDSERDSWCAGDDAGTINPKDRPREVENCAGAIGTIAWEKVFLASEEGAVALKRPITIDHGILFQHANILWPVFSVMCDKDPRFAKVDTDQGLDRVCGAITSFLQSCLRVPLSPSDVEVAYSFFEHFYERFRLPLSGWYPPLTGYHPWRVTIPRMDRDSFIQDPLKRLVNSFFGTVYVSILEEVLPWEGSSTLVLDNSFRCNSCQHLGFLLKLGYLTRVNVEEVLVGTVGLSRALEEVEPERSMSNFVYEFRVVESIPSHLMPF